MTWRRLAPGVYDDGEALHIVIPEMLEGAGYLDTPANRETLAAAALERWPAAEVHD